MKAVRDERTDLLTLWVEDPEDSNKEIRLPGSPRYRDFGVGLGWLDPRGDGDYGKHALVVVGFTETKSYEAFGEAQGSLDEIVPVMIRMKDWLLVEQTFMDMRNEAAVQYLCDPERADGLTAYEQEETDRGHLVYVRNADTWPSFRDRDTVTALVPVDDLFLGNPTMILDLLKSLSTKQKFSVRPECPMVDMVLRKDPPVDEILSHPLFLAVGYAVASMERGRERRAGVGKEPELSYRNLR